MPRITPRIRRTAAVAVALVAGASVTQTGTATAATPTSAPVTKGLYQSAYAVPRALGLLVVALLLAGPGYFQV